jgi:hypothetical protein
LQQHWEKTTSLLSRSLPWPTYLRFVSTLGLPFDIYGLGEIVAWSRILDDEEALCVINPHGTDIRGADILADASLNPSGSRMTVIMNTQDISQSVDDMQNDDKTNPESPGSRMLDAKRIKEKVNIGDKNRL